MRLPGLRAYEAAPRARRGRRRSPKSRAFAARACAIMAATGPPAVLVPSLINPPRILDLDEEVSLAGAIARMGRRVAAARLGRGERSASELDVAGHVEQLLLPLLRSIGEPAALVGYCLGGTMAIAAANLVAVRARRRRSRRRGISRVIRKRRSAALQDMWRHSQAAAASTRRAADGGAAGGLLVARPRAHRRASSPSSAGSIRRAPRRAASSSSRIGRTRASPCPTRPRSELIEDLFGRDLPGLRRMAGRRPDDDRRTRACRCST